MVWPLAKSAFDRLVDSDWAAGYDPQSISRGFAGVRKNEPMTQPSTTAHDALPASRNPRVYVVIPAYNEAAVIADVITAVKASCPDIIVVDDGSRDATGAIARRSGVYVIRHVINRGQGAALQTGIEFALMAGADIIVTFDADGQHDAADISRLTAPIIAGACDIALGSRFLGETIDLPAVRRLLLRAGILFTRVTSGAAVSDTHNGLRAFSRRAAECIRLRLDGMAHASEIIDQVIRSGLPWREIPVTIRYTDYSRAKGQSSRGAIKIAMHYLLGRVMR